MKYGKELNKRSVPEWKAHNIDYNEIKQLIKKATSPRAPPRAVQGVLDMLTDEYDRVNLFVKSKSGEIDRRIDDCEKIVDALAEQEECSTGPAFNSKARQGKLFRLHQAITR
jgi:SPX domain protein involved in polyphosphate accumulation